LRTADRTTAQPDRFGGGNECAQRDSGIDGGIEERIQVIVDEWLAAPFVDLPLPAVVAAKDQEHGGGGRPGIFVQEVRDSAPLGCVFEHDNVALLQVAFRRR
jgi:hypothetical protein